MAQMKELIKTPEKELSDKRITNQSDAEFKTLAIRMLTEMIGLCRKVKEKMKAIQSEINENIQGTKNEGKKTRTQINAMEQKEKETSNQNRMKNKNSKNEERLRNLWDKFKCSNIQIMGVPEGEEEEQEIENLFEKIMKENFPNW